MDDRTLAALEFDALKTLIAPHLRTPLGAAALARLLPQTDAAAIRARKLLVDDAVRHHLQMGRLGPGEVPDPLPILTRMRPEGSILDGQEIRRIGVLLDAAASLRRGITGVAGRFPALAAMAAGIPDLAALNARIEGRIGPDGDLEDVASPRLAEIRRGIQALEARLQRNLQKILERTEIAGLLQDTYVAVRNGRFVIPVLAEARQRVPGIVHGASSTGATVFVEPIETLDLNNDLVTLREEEGAEVRRLLAEWTAMLRERAPEIAIACELLGELDLLGGIGAFAKDWEAIVAREPDDGPGGRGKDTAFVLAGARHPILQAGLRARGEEPIPLEITMEAGGALVISGPNAGGKTVALKTVGLLALMNQAGLPIPAREARVPIFSQVLADIGDHQSIEESLSTFSARMVRVAEMMRELRVPALVLLDEVGAGTDAEEAGALAVAIVDRFRSSGAAIVATTHLEALKAYAEATPGAVNAAMEIDETTMRPTYHLLKGTAGRSGGLNLAARMGLPQEVIEDARSRMSTLHRETQAYLDRLRETAAAREQEIETIRRERAVERERTEAEINGLKRDAEVVKETWSRSLRDALERIDRERDAFLARIEDRTIRLQLTAEARQQSRALREHLASTLARQAPVPMDEGSEAPRRGPGDRVRVRTPGGSSETGTIESVDRSGIAMVLVHGMRMKVPVDELESPAAEAPPGVRGKVVIPRGVKLDAEDKGSAPSELNVIGATVEEALDRLDKFLDDAFLAGHREVRIIHGHGTGRLRSAVRQFLGSHPHVESHAGADRKGGGDGATVAVLAG